MPVSTLQSLRYSIWLLVLLLAVANTQAASTPSQIMSSAMLAMMNSMGDLAQRYKRGHGWNPGNYWRSPDYYSPWSTGGYLPGQPPPPYGAAPYLNNYPRSEVDGIWIGRSGEIVLVMYGYFRIYADAETYRDGEFRIDGDWLLMHDPVSGVTKPYQYVLDNGRMIMRDRQGTVLMFKQLPIPIPPYALFPESGPQFAPDSD
jgi:hypothetical protein